MFNRVTWTPESAGGELCIAAAEDIRSAGWTEDCGLWTGKCREVSVPGVGSIRGPVTSEAPVAYLRRLENDPRPSDVRFTTSRRLDTTEDAGVRAIASPSYDGHDGRGGRARLHHRATMLEIERWMYEAIGSLDCPSTNLRAVRT